jgi:hypothetical protein
MVTVFHSIGFRDKCMLCKFSRAVEFFSDINFFSANFLDFPGIGLASCSNRLLPLPLIFGCEVRTARRALDCTFFDEFRFYKATDIVNEDCVDPHNPANQELSSPVHVALRSITWISFST